MELQEQDLVLCTVREVGRTTVFVKIEGNGEATIVTSEIAPGRIRNLRDYVSPGRRIVCKVLKIDEKGNINLSLRRVSQKETKEVLDLYEKERNSLSILKSVLKEKAEETAEKIKSGSKLYDFLQNCKTSSKELEKYMKKEDAEKICKILQEKKEKEKEVKKEFKFSTKKPDGIKIIKSSLEFCKGNCDISYLAAGRYSIKFKSGDYKKANQEINLALEKIEKSAKQNKADFSCEK